jgi:DNA-binding MarR family transcriptional regulator
MTNPDPSSSPGYVLWKLTHAMQQRMTAELAETGLNLPQVGTLVHVARGEAISTADLARLLLMTPQNLSLTVKKLVAMGYLARRPHETHGRISRLELTPAGEQALLRGVAALSDVEDRMLAGIGGGARQALVAHLQTALGNLQSADGLVHAVPDQPTAESTSGDGP